MPPNINAIVEMTGHSVDRFKNWHTKDGKPLDLYLSQYTSICLFVFLAFIFIFRNYIFLFQLPISDYVGIDTIITHQFRLLAAAVSPPSVVESYLTVYKASLILILVVSALNTLIYLIHMRELEAHFTQLDLRIKNLKASAKIISPLMFTYIVYITLFPTSMLHAHELRGLLSTAPGVFTFIPIFCLSFAMSVVSLVLPLWIWKLLR